MKTFLLFLVCLNVSVCSAQLKDLQILSSAGTTYHAHDLTLDWTIGEVIVSSFENTSMLLTQGFHQSNLSVVSISPVPEDLGTVTVFPNPFSEEIEVNLNYTLPQSSVLQLFDFMGKEIWRKSIEGKDINEKLLTSSFPAGAYLFTVTVPEEPIVFTYQLVKTQ